MRRLSLPIKSFLLFMIIALVVIGCERAEKEELAEAQEQPIKIGVITPLTGAQAKFGEMHKAGYEIALEEINANGGVLGRPLELIYEDDMAKPEIAMSACEKLITQDKVPVIIGSYTSSCTFALSGVAEKYKIPLLVCTGAADKITQQGWQYVYRLNPPSSEYALGLLDFLKAVVKPKNIAILFENTLFGTSTAEAMKKYCEAAGIKVLIFEPYEAGATDFTPTLSKVKATNPEVVFMISYLMDAMLLMRQAKQLDLNPKIFAGGAAGFTLPEFLQGTGKNAEYVVSGTLWTPQVKYPGAKEFYDKALKRFGFPPDYHAAETHAALYVVADVIRRAGEVESEKIKAAFDTADMMTIFGPVKFGSYENYTHQNKLPTLVLQVQNGKFETIFPEAMASAAPIYPIPKWSER